MLLYVAAIYVAAVDASRRDVCDRALAWLAQLGVDVEHARVVAGVQQRYEGWRW